MSFEKLKEKRIQSSGWGWIYTEEDVLAFLEEQEVEHRKKIEQLENALKIHINDLRMYVEQDKELKEALEKITTAIVSEKVEKPKSWYEFEDKPFTAKDLAKWFEATENFYHFAKRYEEQERGRCCCVDRAYKDWLIPECKKLLEKLKEIFSVEKKGVKK